MTQTVRFDEVNRSFRDTESFNDLASQLRFNQKEARIWLHQSPMLLLHAHTFGVLRHELIESLGIKKARALLTRMGYQSGTRDAQMVMDIRENSDTESFFRGGPQLHGLEGFVLNEAYKLELDAAKGQFDGDFGWTRSTEAEVHIEQYGNANLFPVCWMQTGYAAGYASMVMGKSIIFKEVECAAMGYEACRVIGKPMDAWEDVEEQLDDLFEREISGTPRASGNVVMTGGRKATATVKDSNWEDLIGTSDAFNIVCHKVNRVRSTDATVLFLGESGVGKEIFARKLHQLSDRADGPFIAVNCAAIPEDILEAELFGVEKGAFTGAQTSRPGRFERAHGGTVFLDEIGLLSLPAQGKLLRVLQEREVERLGGTSVIEVDIRIVAATNENLYERVTNQGGFRRDLFYRLNVFPIDIPPLRERLSDIPLLMEHFLRKFSQKYNKQVTGFEENAIEALIQHKWPGNIRELENCIERSVILAENHQSISYEVLPAFQQEPTVAPEAVSAAADNSLLQKLVELLAEGRVEQPKEASTPDFEALCDELLQRVEAEGRSVDQITEKLFELALQRTEGNIAEASRVLGITRARAAHRLKKMNNRSAPFS